MKNKNSDFACLSDTSKRYGFLWSTYWDVEPPDKYHFNCMQEVITERIVRGALGLDLGCGCGWDTFTMAKDNPSVRIIGMDISYGVYNAFKVSSNLKNVNILRGSALDIPLKNEACDFVYSFGVVHHIPDYKKCLIEIARVLKKSSLCFMYLYEDHSDNTIKYICIKIINIIRKITIKIPPRILYFLCCLASPFIVMLFSYPAIFFKRFKATKKLYEKMPFNFGKDFFSLGGDLYDRFGTPIEHRFS